MPVGLFGLFPACQVPARDLPGPGPMQGKRRGVTKPPGRAKRRNRRKP
jgi:hypothetical protein